jgi:ubiquitin-activating enzyme E1
MEKDIILISIDSQSGKEYLDRKATTFEIPMILGATLGPLAKAETFVPFETWCLNDKGMQMDNEDNETTPPCTLRYFPTRIEDCIDWAKERFADLFIIPFQRLNNLKKSSDFINRLKDIPDEEEKIFILNFIHVIKECTVEKIIEYGLKFFIYYFTDWAKKIYEKYLLDYLNEDGTAFWDKNKIKPIEIIFNLKDDLCKNFILAYIKIFSEIIGNSEKILKNEEALLIKIKQISTEENLEKLRQQFNNEKYNLIYFEQIILDTKKALDLNNRINTYNILEFDKDDIKKGHINFIHSISNLRANIYKISNCDELKIFKYIGKIGPSTITSTATIVGFNILQMIRLIINKNENEKVIHSYQIDMSQNMYIMTNKINPIYKEDESIDEVSGKKIKNIPRRFSCWDKLLINGPITIQEIINLFYEKYNVSITSILTCEGMNIYEKIVLKKNDFYIEEALNEKKKEDEKLKKNIEDVYFNEMNLDKSTFGYNYLFFKILGIFGKGHKANIPTIKYKIN